ncbi:MAG: hypothetical protein RBQ72_12620 [Desulfobacterium sp.]|jgi:hypothetical protein|nr:hypothetical protein [Desulfobacterium sp.]
MVETPLRSELFSYSQMREHDCGIQSPGKGLGVLTAGRGTKQTRITTGGHFQEGQELVLVDDGWEHGVEVLV